MAGCERERSLVGWGDKIWIGCVKRGMDERDRDG